MPKFTLFYNILLFLALSRCLHCLRQLMCGTGQEGERGNITIHWEMGTMETGGMTLSKVGLGDVVYCESTGKCHQINNSTGHLLTSVTKSTNNLTINVTITNVTRQHEGFWKITDNSVTDRFTDSCYFSVYAMPKEIQCQRRNSALEDTFVINCTASRVYPQAKCRFELRDTETQNTTELNQEITYEHLLVEGGNEYVTTKCMITIHTKNLSTNHEVVLSMFPNVTGSLTDAKFGLTYSYRNETSVDQKKNTFSRTLLLIIIISVAITFLVLMLLIISIVQAVIKTNCSNKRSRKLKEPYDYIIGFQVDTQQLRRTKPVS